MSPKGKQLVDRFFGFAFGVLFAANVAYTGLMVNADSAWGSALMSGVSIGILAFVVMKGPS